MKPERRQYGHKTNKTDVNIRLICRSPDYGSLHYLAYYFDNVEQAQDYAEVRNRISDDGFYYVGVDVSEMSEDEIHQMFDKLQATKSGDSHKPNCEKS